MHLNTGSISNENMAKETDFHYQKIIFLYFLSPVPREGLSLNNLLMF